MCLCIRISQHYSLVPGLVEGGLWLDWLACRLPTTTYESNVLYALRFMVDRGISGGCWLEAPAGRWHLVPAQGRVSHCQLEAHIAAADLVSHEPEGEWARIAPFRILSVDIECQGRKVSRDDGWVRVVEGVDAAECISNSIH